MAQENSETYEHLLRQGGDAMLREASAHFAGEGRLRGTLRRLAQQLDVERIPHSLLEGLALGDTVQPSMEQENSSVTPKQACVSKS